MTVLAHWNQLRSDDEIVNFKRGLVQGALKFLKEKGNDTNSDFDADKLISGIQVSTSVHPGWASLHSESIRAAMEPSGIRRCMDLLRRSNSITLEAEDELRVVFSQSLQRQSQRSSVKRARQVDYDFASAEEVAKLIPVVSQSLSLLQRVWPEQRVLVDKIVSHIIFFRAPHEWSSCDALTFGTVYYNSEFGSSPLDLAEGLVHEVGHHSLLIKQTFRPLVTNPEALCCSPLRADPRPVIGLFHAVFVLKRILEFYERVERNENDCKHIQRERVAQYRISLGRGLLTLSETANFTAFGRSLFESLNGNSGNQKL